MNYKSNYSNQEWELRKQYYINEVSNLVIPREATGYEIKILSAMNNNLLSQAYLDKASIYESLDKLERKLKIMSEECWATIDWDDVSPNKLIKEEKNAFIIHYIKNSTANEQGVNLYNVLDLYSSRAKFIDNVVFNLKDKAGALLNLISLLKMENDLLKTGNMNGQRDEHYA